MSNTYFKSIFITVGTHADGSPMVAMLSVVPPGLVDGMDKDCIKEFQCIQQPPNIYTGAFPNIRIIPDTEVIRDDLKGVGLSGIAMQEGWYIKDGMQSEIQKVLLPEIPTKQ